jgi:predicted secreted protein
LVSEIRGQAHYNQLLAELFVGLMVLGYLYFLTTRQRREESEDEVMRGPFEIVADELGTVK